MNKLRRLAAFAALVIVGCTIPAWAVDDTKNLFTVWAIGHVGISLTGTVFLLWLIRRGVKKL